MAKKNITFVELEKWEEKYLRERLAGSAAALNFFAKPVSEAMLKKISGTNILGVFIYSKIDKGVLDKLPQLEMIATMSTGFDHIDLKECAKRQIKISNVPFYGENTVAEHTLALILALSRKLPKSMAKVQKYDFELRDIRGFDLKGKTLGLVGLGHIGQHVARMARGFEMKVIAYDPKRDNRAAKELGVGYVSLEQVLSGSDIISLHAPYNQKTHHMLNKKNMKLIKPGAYLVNTARGGLVETDALIWALNKKILAGAGLDVLEEECFIKEEKELLSRAFKETCNLQTILQGHYLINDERVLVTPHNAFNSVEALGRILETTVDNIRGYLKKKPINLVS